MGLGGALDAGEGLLGGHGEAKAGAGLFVQVLGLELLGVDLDDEVGEGALVAAKGEDPGAALHLGLHAVLGGEVVAEALLDATIGGGAQLDEGGLQKLRIGEGVEPVAAQAEGALVIKEAADLTVARGDVGQVQVHRGEGPRARGRAAVDVGGEAGDELAVGQAVRLAVDVAGAVGDEAHAQAALGQGGIGGASGKAGASGASGKAGTGGTSGKGGGAEVDFCEGAFAKYQGNGLYCGSQLAPGATDKWLYECKGFATVKIEKCALGCQTAPDGQNDACKQPKPDLVGDIVIQSSTGTSPKIPIWSACSWTRPASSRGSGT